MRKILYFAIAFIAAGIGFVSCGDNEDFSIPHQLTDDEIREIHRQDSLDSVARTRIDADLVLKYKVSDYATADGVWNNKQLKIDLDQVAELFGMTEAELVSNIESGKVKGCAMDANTHAMIETSSTTNGPIGHWWTKFGTPGTWADDLENLMMFCEWAGHIDEETGEPKECYFNVGQFPGRLEPGYSLTVYEGMKYQDKRVIFEITFRIIDPDNMSIVGTQDVNVTLPVNPKGYDLNFVKFDLNKVYFDLDTKEIDPKIDLIAYDAEGAFTQAQTADNGFWFLDGHVDSFKESLVEVVYNADPEQPDVIGICLKPKKTNPGDVFTQDFGFTRDGVISMLHVTVNVVEAE